MSRVRTTTRRCAPALPEVLSCQLRIIADMLSGLHYAHEVEDCDGTSLGLLTNGSAEMQRAKIVRFALETYFDWIQIEGEQGFGKPEPRAFRHARAGYGIAARAYFAVTY